MDDDIIPPAPDDSGDWTWMPDQEQWVRVLDVTPGAPPIPGALYDPESDQWLRLS
jgi:hypothetical protein